VPPRQFITPTTGVLVLCGTWDADATSPAYSLSLWDSAASAAEQELRADRKDSATGGTKEEIWGTEVPKRSPAAEHRWRLNCFFYHPQKLETAVGIKLGKF